MFQIFRQNNMHNQNTLPVDIQRGYRKTDNKQINVRIRTQTFHKIIFSNVAFTIKYTQSHIHNINTQKKIMFSSQTHSFYVSPFYNVKQQTNFMILHLCHKWFCRDERDIFDAFFARCAIKNGFQNV